MSLNIGVFLGSKLGNDKEILKLITKFSEWLINQSHTLIIGGTDSGLMQLLAKQVYKKNCVKAIYTRMAMNSAKQYDFFTELIVVDDSVKKKEIFEEKSDLFIAFPGGVGTLDEIVDIINRNNLQEINKKIFLINEGFYWNKFNELLNFFKSNKFTHENLINSNLIVCSFDQFKLEIKKINAKNKN